MELQVFDVADGYVLVDGAPCAPAVTRIGSGPCLGTLDLSEVGEMTATMLAAAIEGDGYFCIGRHAANILFRCAGGIKPLEQSLTG